MADEIAEKFEAISLGRGSSSRGGRGGGKSGGRAGGGGSGGRGGRDINLSRALSKLLRHQAANAGIQLDNEGYAPLDKVVSFLSFFSFFRFFFTFLFFSFHVYVVLYMD